MTDTTTPYPITEDTVFKFLNSDNTSSYQNTDWHTPYGKRPGKWMAPITGKLEACENGYHLCRPADLTFWFAPVLYVAEWRGEMVESDNKIVVRQARLMHKVDTWNDRTAWLFACDCTEKAFEGIKNIDPRSIEAVRMVRRYTLGDATKEEMITAKDNARAADLAAYRAADRAADLAAYRAAYLAAYRAADRAAYRAADRAAYRAAYRAADRAAYLAAKQWQTDRLMMYLRGEVPEAIK